jgi:CubicO group peptidase (beta-lactamase class C family)
MTLYEEGRFLLDDPASKFIPELADVKVFDSGTAASSQVREPSRPMTVRDLLMHTSGLVGRETATPVGELYRRALQRHDPRRAAAHGPSGRYRCSGSRCAGLAAFSTDLVGYLCEVICGLPFDDSRRAQ